MKTHRLRLLLVCVPLWALSSCSKEDANSNAPTPATGGSNIVRCPEGQLCPVDPTPTEKVYPQPGYSQVAASTLTRATEIAVTGNGFALMISQPTEERYFSRVRYRNTNYTPNSDPWTNLESPEIVQIASHGQNAWAVDAQGNIFYNYFGLGQPQRWVQFSANNQPRATAIATDGDETGLFILGDTWITGGHPVYKYDRTSNSWSQVGTQGGIRLHVDEFGRPWIVTDTGDMYRSAGYSQTFSGWNYMQKPAGRVIDVTQLRYVSNPDLFYAMAILVIPEGSQSTLASVYWQPYGTPEEMTSSRWSNSLGGVGKRIVGTGALWLLGPDGVVWNKPL
jgi:hypothetical protein